MMQLSDLSKLSDAEELDEIRKLIEDSFMHDWAIKIEYADRSDPQSIRWVQWDETFFAINDVRPVLQNIYDCCKSHPDCSMKMICEHFNPDYRFIYCIHQNKLTDDPTLEKKVPEPVAQLVEQEF